MTKLPRRAVLGWPLGAFALGGCSALASLNAPPPQLYELTPKSTFPPDLPEVDWQLLIDPPSASAGIDTERIVISENPTSIDYFAGVAWTDRAPAMVHTLLVESFENSGKIVSIGRESSALRADFVLQTELREFRAERWPGEPYRVRVRINGKVIRIPQRIIIANQSVEEVVPVQGNDFAAVIAAWDEALDRVLKKTVEWVLLSSEQDYRANGGRRRRR